MPKKWKAKWGTKGGHGVEVEHLKKEMVDELCAKAEAKGYVVTRCGPGESLTAPAKKVVKAAKKKSRIPKIVIKSKDETDV